jgi:hypothetical protein
VHHLDQVVAGDAVVIGQVRDRDARLRLPGKVDQHPKTVVGEQRQLHGRRRTAAAIIGRDPATRRPLIEVKGRA